MAGLASLKCYSLRVPGNSVQISGFLHKTDIIRFQYVHMFHNLWVKILIGLFAIGWLPYCIFRLMTQEGLARLEFISSTIPITLPCLLLLCVPLVNAELVFRKTPRIAQKISYMFDEQGIQSDMEDSSGRMGWSVIHRLGETNSLFLFYISPYFAWLVPKRFFANDADMQIFLELLSAHVEPLKIKNYRFIPKGL